MSPSVQKKSTNTISKFLSVTYKEMRKSSTHTTGKLTPVFNNWPLWKPINLAWNVNNPYQVTHARAVIHTNISVYKKFIQYGRNNDTVDCLFHNVIQITDRCRTQMAVNKTSGSSSSSSICITTSTLFKIACVRPVGGGRSHRAVIQLNNSRWPPSFAQLLQFSSSCIRTLLTG